MNGLDLFSGIGGITKALEGYVRPITYCESDRYAQGVLLSRMREGSLPVAPIWDDVRTLHGSMLPVRPEIIYGGFPCQDISVAGHGKGLAGKRSGLFFEIIRLVETIRPAFVFLENVSAIRTRGGEEVIKEFSRLRYDCRWGMLSAYDVGAPHKRERWWLLAYANKERLQASGPSSPGNELMQRALFGGKGDVAHSDGSGRREQRGGQPVQPELNSPQCTREDIPHSGGVRETQRRDEGLPETERAAGWWSDNGSRKALDEPGEWWKTEPPVGRLVDGIPNRVDQLRALGNSVVPAQAREAFKRLMGLK